MNQTMRQAIREEAARLELGFVAAGAMQIHAETLLPAGRLLDLYGEDLRARAYVTNDPVRGEMMLRPDFTLPIVERHMEEGAEPARYTYNGMVWRKQKARSTRPNEYTQVGFELFERENPPAADAEVFAIFCALLPDEIAVTTGDIGLLRAAVNGLATSDRRIAALQRHLWRPRRFRQLLERFSGEGELAQSRVDLLASIKRRGAEKLLKKAGKHVGLRSINDIKERIEVLEQDQEVDDIPSQQLLAIETLLDFKGTVEEAAEMLDELVIVIPAMQDAIDRFNLRLEALGGLTPGLAFEGSFGLTSMEYYDGFVFAFTKDEQVVASGGRYDALTEVLGQGRTIPAVGGVIRPDVLLGVQDA